MANPFHYQGLTDAEVSASRKKFGTNIAEREPGYFWPVIRDIVREPMFLLLVATSTIYFILGQYDEAIFMIVAIFLVSGISFFQDQRSRKAVKSLHDFTKTNARVLRNGIILEMPSEQIVMGDFVIVEEGTLIPADGIIRHSNDFTVNESILTGESFTVSKDVSDPENNTVFQGTFVSSGLALFEVNAIGKDTRIGNIGKSLLEITEAKSPLQRQIEVFVKRMAITGIAVFSLIWLFNYLKSDDILNSLLKGLTLAMSILPEEIPVAFTTFMALGAWRLMKQGIIVKQIRTVETLGSATTICIDKTGTITENRMELQKVYVHADQQTLQPDHCTSAEALHVVEVAMWASEPIPFDPMEIALHNAYTNLALTDKRRGSKMIHEYPLSGKPPMMTHIFRTAEGKTIVAAKGAPESILRYSTLTPTEKENISSHWTSMTKEGYRVLGVAEATQEEDQFLPAQESYAFKFLGLVAFYDPPKSNIAEVLADFYRAGLEVKIITGDNENTTASIAKKIQLKSTGNALDGRELMKLNDTELQETVTRENIFTRMFPDAKLRIINALKAKDRIVAMTGDGVNDGPALKAAHIGIAMGKRGSALAKQAASLILVEDDLKNMVDAIAMGRKIYGNLKKAIQYIISIHIPIILTVSLPLFMGWIYPDIFTPVHVIFLELIMGPTCSIVYENEPLEKKAMSRPPREATPDFLSWQELRTSILQGLMITAGTMFSYQYAVAHHMSEELTRSMVFSTLVVANIFLTLVNRSFDDSMFSAVFYKNNLMRVIIALTILLLVLIIYSPALNNFFRLEPLSIWQLVITIISGLVSVIWFEGFKYWKRHRSGR